MRAEINDVAGNRQIAVRHYLDAIRLGDRAPRLIGRCVELLVQARRFVEADQVIRHLSEEYIPLSRNLTQIASNLSIQLQDFDRALDLAVRRAKQSEKQADLFWLAQILRITGNFTKAENQFRKAIEISPSSPEPWIALVQMHCGQGKLSLAKTVISEAEHSISTRYLFDTLAQCYQSTGDERSAEEYYRKAINECPTDSSLLRRFTSFYLESGRIAKAIPLLERLVANSSKVQIDDQIWGRRNLALSIGIQGDQESNARALRLIKENIKSSENSTEDLRCLAILLSKDGRSENSDKGLKILVELVAKQTTFSIPDNALLADLYRQRNDWANYSRTMRRVLGNGGAEIADYVSQYATALIDRGELNEGKLWLNQLIELAPDSVTTIKAESKVLFTEGKFTALTLMLEQAAESSELNQEVAPISEYYGIQLRRAGQVGLSERMLKIALQANTEIARYDSAGDLRLASFYARTGNVQKALDLIPREDANALQLVALAYGAIQSGTEDRDCVAQLISYLQAADKATLTEVLLCVGDLYSWLGDTEKACDAYNSVLESDPSNVSARNNLAAICALTSKQLGQAMFAIESVIGDLGPQAAFLDTRGLVHMAAGRFDAAEVDFRKAIDLAGKATYHFHLAQIFAYKQRFTDAGNSLRVAKKQLDIHTLLPIERASLQRLQTAVLANASLN
ncbi:MAG: tetratricopeptide repeat protein [Planctomycetota bacterium]|nr:tetratricopeptide repeat protein [Planctomycetota bacterium]